MLSQSRLTFRIEWPTFECGVNDEVQRGMPTAGEVFYVHSCWMGPASTPRGGRDEWGTLGDLTCWCCRLCLIVSQSRCFSASNVIHILAGLSQSDQTTPISSSIVSNFVKLWIYDRPKCVMRSGPNNLITHFVFKWNWLASSELVDYVIRHSGADSSSRVAESQPKFQNQIRIVNKLQTLSQWKCIRWRTVIGNLKKTLACGMHCIGERLRKGSVQERIQSHRVIDKVT